MIHSLFSSGLYLIKYDDGYGNYDCEMDLEKDGAILTWIGNNGEEIGQMEITYSEAFDLLYMESA